MKKKIIIFASFILIIFGLYIYSRYLEPNIIRVNYKNINNKLVNANNQGIKILQFSDLHISEYFNAKELERTIKDINKENPDVVIFTGDLFEHFNDYSYKKDVNAIIELLSKINAPLGKYAVYGNHDYGGGAERIFKDVMEKSGFIILVNDSVYLNDYNINIVGLDDSIFGSIDKEKVAGLLGRGYFNLVISHEPDIIDFLLEHNIDLFISGHSHGGQINLPFISSLILPKLGEKYVKGLYKFENSRNTNLYVNVGIGTSQIPFRFMAIPEITVFRIINK